MNNNYLVPVLSTLCGILCLCVSLAPAYAAKQKSQGIRFEDKDLLIRTVIRSPEQLDAFYSGRGFPRKAIDEIKKTCFVTMLIKNKQYEALWLILDDWEFYDMQGKRINRISRQQWTRVWDSIALKPAFQSTFGWTQLPESRDLRKQEHAGGNVTIPWHNKPFKLIARFKTRLDKSGETRKVVLENLQCKK